MQSKHFRYLAILTFSCSLALTTIAQADSSMKTGTEPVPKNEVKASADGEDVVFEKAETKPMVDVKQWRSNLEAKLFPLIESAVKQNISPGKHTIFVRFIVEKDGTVTNVKAMNDPGFGLAKGAENIVKTGPKWKPGEQGGREVRSYHTQPIVFVIEEETIEHQ